MKDKMVGIIVLIMGLTLPLMASARTTLVALPDRDATVIRLDHPQATLIEEERQLTLQKGLNKIDFSWKGVHIDADSIRLRILDHPEQVTLLNVSYPPNEAALAWEIASKEDFVETVRISYLLYSIDRLITYKAVADKMETSVDFKSYLILRNFSGEDFENALVQLDDGQAFEQTIAHEETKRLLYLKAGRIPITKIWKWDSARLPWDPEALNNQNVGVPVRYRIANDPASGLGHRTLWGGKARIFQDDGHGSTIYLGEDIASLVPVGEKMELKIGESRDIVVTQRKMRENRINIRRTTHKSHPRIVLYDIDEEITAKIENFKDQPAVLTMLQHIPGEWKMVDCNLDYQRNDSQTLKFEIKLPARSEKGPAVIHLKMNYHRLNLRP
jgi:hypothetical protein